MTEEKPDFETALKEQLDKLPYTKHLDDGKYNDGRIDGFELGARWAYNSHVLPSPENKDFEKMAENYSAKQSHLTYIKCGPSCINNAENDFVDHTFAIRGWYKDGMETIWNSHALPLQKKIKELESDIVEYEQDNKILADSSLKDLTDKDSHIADLTEGLEKQQAAVNFFQPLYEQGTITIEYLNGRIKELEAENEKWMRQNTDLANVMEDLRSAGEGFVSRIAEKYSIIEQLKIDYAALGHEKDSRIAELEMMISNNP